MNFELLLDDFSIKVLTENLYDLKKLENNVNYVNCALFAIKRFYKLKKERKISYMENLPDINWTTFDNQNPIWNDLINELVKIDMYVVPVKNINQSQILEGIINSNDYHETGRYINSAKNTRNDLDFEIIYQTLFDSNMFSIVYIPQKYQTDNMIEKILPEINKNNCKILKWLKPTLEVNKLEVNKKILELCDIKDIPYYLHTYELCVNAIEKNPINIAIINHEFINDTILKIYFKHESLKHIPRSERFSIITNFDEDRIIKILQYRPMLILHLSDSQRTYNLLKSLVTFNGYSLQYLTKEELLYNNGEFVKIALNKEPNAKKYLI